MADRNPGRGRKPPIDGCPRCQSTSVVPSSRAGGFTCSDCGTELVRLSREATFGRQYFFVPLNRPGVQPAQGVPRGSRPHYIDDED